MHRKTLGRRGEDDASRYLVSKGYRLVQRNFRCPAGEIDIIALDGRTMVFVEVRCRSTDSFGLPQESVGRQKQAKLRLAARHYLAAAGGHIGPLRFDVLALKYGPGQRLERLEHIRNAF
ncbi:YraN family protein [Desulfofundulus thermobenzoicus]|nr:YraN family protein [Desulfofundulus thermobenzoicus]